MKLIGYSANMFCIILPRR